MKEREKEQAAHRDAHGHACEIVKLERMKLEALFHDTKEQDKATPKKARASKKAIAFSPASNTASDTAA